MNAAMVPTREARETRDVCEAPAQLDVFDALESILRKPGEIAEARVAGRTSRTLAVTSLAAIAIGMALFGGVVGSMRGGAQIAYASVKMPLAILATLVSCVPAFHAFAAALGRPWTCRAVASRNRSRHPRRAARAYAASVAVRSRG